MQTGNMTTTQNAPWIPEVIANKALGLLGNYLNLGATVAKDSEMNPARVGQVLSIPRRGVIEAQQKSQGTPSVVQRPVADDITVTVDQHWYVKLLEEDFTRAMQTESALPGYLEDAIIVLAEKIEGNLIDHIDEFDNIDAGGSAGDAYKAVVDVRKRMVKNKIPQLAQRFGYLSPGFYARLLKEEAILDPKVQTGESSRITGLVGRTAGFDLFEGQLAPTSGSPAWDQNFFYTRNALVLASRPLLAPGRELGVDATTVQSDAGIALRLVRAYDKDEMGVVITLDTVFGSGVNDSRQGFVLESQG